MELDDLRRQWQQPEPAAPPMNQAALSRLLAQRSDGLVEKMRRNARLETAFVALTAIAMPLIIGFADNFLERAQVVSLFLLALVLLGYYYRKLKMLRRMTRPDAHVLGNLRRLCAGLRSMLRFNYRLTLAMVPASLLLMYEYMVGKELARPGGVHTAMLLGLGAAFFVTGLLLQWAVVKATRWYLQRLYGQHLDRLEASLRELAESEPPTAY
ncbi:hypothetical protein [Hymenobacter terricola]|uniref:hypothetical protein n=1 Tax=Hymenobacter terricola TaxID=2819236 RepID=UPI001B30D215|nr:hypothetical protein [Hymenobacter terricola]